MIRRSPTIGPAAFAAIACGWLSLGAAPARAQTLDNTLLVLIDDWGMDKRGGPNANDEGALQVPFTPRIDALAAGGILFRSAYSNVVCSSTRAMVQTGRYAGRTGIGTITGTSDGSTWTLQLAEITIPEMLELDPGVPDVATAMIGKWHLSGESTGGPLAPNLQGYDHSWITLGNITDYDSYEAYTDGVLTPSTTYATTETVNRALQWIGSAPEPWLVCLAFNAPHNPWHVPPWVLHQSKLPWEVDPREQPLPHYNAALQAVDAELARLLDGLGAARGRTNVILLGDNGTPREASVPPFPDTHAKLTPHNNAVRAPLIVNGPAVQQPGREVTGLVSAADVFATVADLYGMDLATHYPPGVPLDSVSLLPYLSDPRQDSLRSTVYSEFFAPNGEYEHALKQWQLIRGPRYRLQRADNTASGTIEEEFYDLLLDPFETTDLLLGALTPEEQQAYDELVQGIADVVGSY